MRHSLKARVLMLAVLAATAVTNAAAVTIDTFDNGWYDQDGSHGPSNQNIWTGSQGASTSSNTNHFLAFDLAAAAGQVITGATLRYHEANGSYNSSDPSETVEWYDYLGDIDQLLGGTAGVAGYADMANGALYGTEVVNGRPEPNIGQGDPMPEVVGIMSAQAIADMNAALLAVDQRFVIGATIPTSVFGEQQKLWWGSLQQSAAQLILTFDQAVPAPEPGTLALLALGLAGIGARRKLR